MLKGVLLEVDDVSLTGVALDGYRLAKCVKPVEKTTASMRALVPARCLTEIARLIDDEDAPVEVCVQKNYLAVDLEHTRVTTRLMDVDFINYKQIIPAYFETMATLPKDQFEAGIERAVLLSRSDKSNLVRFDLRENVLQLSSTSDIGNVTRENLYQVGRKGPLDRVQRALLHRNTPLYRQRKYRYKVHRRRVALHRRADRFARRLYVPHSPRAYAGIKVNTQSLLKRRLV